MTSAVGNGSAQIEVPIDSKSSKLSSITVAVRVRPFTPTEESNLITPTNERVFLGDGSLSSKQNNDNDASRDSNSLMPKGIRKILNVVDDRMLIFDPPETNPLAHMQKNAFPNAKSPRIREHRFVFDKLFDMLASQDDIFNSTTRPLLDSVLDGYNATVFAYGATGCGKTYTILGTPMDPGVIFLTMKELYGRINSLSDTKIIDVSLSFLEIYNETIRDLLQPETDYKKLILREDANNSITVSNLLTHKPNSVEEVMDLIIKGNQNRTSSPTEANSTSSRSHAVLQINVIQKERTASICEDHTFATFTIIDLAGSERAAATKNRGARLNEGANINKSLLALGNCINALCDPKRRNHVPYRDSKLTRLLKFSLGGNCKTVMIVCVSPLSQHYDETLNTLKYADRAKEIKTKLIRNRHSLDRHVGSYLKMITEQKQEIEELRSREQEVRQECARKHNKIHEGYLKDILNHISNLKTSLLKQHQEKWRKFFTLAKRKILMVQKLRAETLLYHINVHQQVINISQELNTLCNFTEQLISKLDVQISDLEQQFIQLGELDHILTESSRSILKKLKENEYWNDTYSDIFESLVNSLRDDLEKEVFFNSSILYDHLLYEINDFDFLPKSFSDVLCQILSPEKKTADDYSSQLASMLKHANDTTQLMVNGDFDYTIEQITSEFLTRKSDLLDRAREWSSIPRLNETPSLSKPRESKRTSNSPLRSSPPRGLKKSTKNAIPSLSSKMAKKVRWNMPGNNVPIDESDMSLDDINSQENTFLKSDVDDDSPLANTVLDKSELVDDLDFKFDPSLDSPPLFKVSNNLNYSISRDVAKSKTRPQRSISLANRQLLPNDNDEGQTKLPLLNKEASTKLVRPNQASSPESGTGFNIANIGNSYLPGPQSRTKFKMHSLGAPARIINKYNMNESSARNIDSNGSEKVD